MESPPPFVVTVERGRSDLIKVRRNRAGAVSLTLLVGASAFLFVSKWAAQTEFGETGVDFSLSELAINGESLADVNICQTGIHQSPIDLPESGTRLDELPRFGWAEDSSSENAVELFQNNAFQVFLLSDQHL
jgi:hypothetical protein